MVSDREDMIMKVTVTAGEYVDRTLPTASWWDRYTLTSGEYELRLTTVQGDPVPEGQRPYYAMAEVDATLVESYRVNRLFTASSSEVTYPNRSATVCVQMYAYELASGRKVLDGHGTVTSD
jgi:hypothetical protein